MRTADTIAQQQEVQESQRDTQGSDHATEQVDRSPFQLRPYLWKKGQSGNPGGRPKRDRSAEFARSLFDIPEDELERYRIAFCKQLLKGNAYVFKELAERGYGKLKEVVAVEGTDDAGLADLTKRLIGALADLGLVGQIEAIGSDQSGRGNQEAQGTEQVADILPGNGAIKTGAVS